MTRFPPLATPACVLLLAAACASATRAPEGQAAAPRPQAPAAGQDGGEPQDQASAPSRDPGPAAARPPSDAPAPDDSVQAGPPGQSPPASANVAAPEGATASNPRHRPEGSAASLRFLGPLTPAAIAWVDSTLAELPLRRKIAQMVMPWVSAEYMAVDSDRFQDIARLIEEEGVGGVITSVGAPLEVASNLALMQRRAEIPLLVAADLEYGAGRILDGGVVHPFGVRVGSATKFPPPMAIGATGDPDLAYQMGRITAEEARAVGIHVAFAPVVDVNNNPDNPIINVRSYGADPAAVARFARAHVRGLQDHGMIATPKHFPGHGDTGTDSHIELPVIGVDATRADSVELVPFGAAIDAGAGAVMSAHIAFPALTGDSVPATLNPVLLDSLLRGALGFDGIVVTDALVMGGIAKAYGDADAAVRAVEAGADVLLIPGSVGRTIDALERAVVAGDIPEARIDASARRLLATKAALGLPGQREVDFARIPAVLGSRANARVAREAARRSLTALVDRDGRLPLARTGRVLAVLYGGDPGEPDPGSDFRAALGARIPGLRTVTVHEPDLPLLADSLRALAEQVDAVVFAPFLRVRAWQGDLAFSAEAAAFLEWLEERHTPLVVVSFGDPYLIRSVPSVGTYVLAWGQEQVVQEAAAAALVGETAIEGRLPIDIPPFGAIGDGLLIPGDDGDIGSARDAFLQETPPDAVGMDARGLAAVDSTLEAWIERGASPGAALVVGRRGRIVRLRGYGRIDWAPDAPAVDDSTVWDLASLTKTLATTTAVMMLADAGRVTLDAPLSTYLDAWPTTGPLAAVTLRNLLRHDAGLRAFAPLRRLPGGTLDPVAAIAALEPAYRVGERTLYSDLGPILAGEVVERVTGMGLDVFVRRYLVEPLGLRETGFNPGRPGGCQCRARIAPTETDRVGGRGQIRGDVHDPNAYALGGVAGHAGLFSSARDLAVLAQFLLDDGRFARRRLVRAPTVATFVQPQGESTTRTLGWETPGERSSAGELFSARSFGHTGFTGTSLWVDPDQDLFVILLTNRVNPTAANRMIFDVRRDVHDAVQRAIIDTPPVARRGSARRGSD
jgi:beta-N-acetylhexosaminidase